MVGTSGIGPLPATRCTACQVTLPSPGRAQYPPITSSTTGIIADIRRWLSLTIAGRAHSPPARAPAACDDGYCIFVSSIWKRRVDEACFDMVALLLPAVVRFSDRLLKTMAIVYGARRWASIAHATFNYVASLVTLSIRRPKIVLSMLHGPVFLQRANKWSRLSLAPQAEPSPIPRARRTNQAPRGAEPGDVPESPV